MDHNSEDDSENPNHERWLVSYADFITLLFAFFTVLYATSNRDIEKTQKFQESVKRFLIKSGPTGQSSQNINEGDKYNSPIEQPIPTYNQAQTPAAIQETFKKVEGDLDHLFTREEKSRYIYDIQLDELGVRIVLSGYDLFTPDTPKFRADAIPVLSKLGDYFAQLGRQVVVQGNSNSKVKNSIYPSSWEFASARATAMVRYFIKVHKMAPNRFVPISYGDRRPLVSESGTSPKNEHIELVILNEDLAI